MALENFIPEIWSARLLANLHTALVYGQAGVVNRDYEGEISAAGDTVHINNIGAVTVVDYTKNADLAAPETLTDATRTLLVDQSKAFNFQVDDIDQAQQKPKVMNEAMREAAFALGSVSDTFLSAAMAAGAGITPAPVTPTAADAYDLLVDLAVALDETDTPSEGRFAAVPPWFHGLLLKDNRFVDASASGSTSALRNAVAGDAAGFKILKSNRAPSAVGPPATNTIIAGHPSATSYAEQINKVEAYRPERRFADAVKGLHLYGAKVVRADQLVAQVINI